MIAPLDGFPFWRRDYIACRVLVAFLCQATPKSEGLEIWSHSPVRDRLYIPPPSRVDGNNSGTIPTGIGTLAKNLLTKNT